MMEESDVWEIVLEPMVGSMIDSKITTDLDLQFANIVEVQREKIGVGENTSLVEREC
jgi:hypothetical protein